MTAAATFSLTVTQGGTGITADLSSAGVEIHAKAKAARTCAYSYTVAGDGALDLTALVGATVVVTLDTGSGAQTIFTGRINRTPTYDTARRAVAITATDGWQEYCDGNTLAELQVLIPNGLYQEDIDGPRVSGLQQTIALLSTTPEDAALNRSGTFAVWSWTPKASGSEDGTVTASQVRDVVPELADADELVNSISVTYEHSFTRRVWNEVHFGWSGIGDWCTWYTTLGHDLPTHEEIHSVAAGTGWPVIGTIDITGHPVSDPDGGVQWVDCPDYEGWILTDYLRTEATAAGWDGGQTYAVECSETLTLTVTASSSVTAYGSRPSEMAYSANTPYATDAVDADDSPAEPAGMTSYGTGDSQSYNDEIDSTQRSANVAASLAKARVRILETHRRNTVTWTMLADPTLDLGDTWTITHPLSTCRGVVTELRHRISATAALTTPTVAAYIGAGGSDDTLSAPSMIIQAPTESAPADVVIYTKVGNMLDSEDYDEDWELGNYWVCNFPPWICSPPNCPTDDQIYETTGLYVSGPDIPDTAREAIELTQSASYAVAIPASTITISGG